MKLYYSPGACSMASHIVLREIGAKFEAVNVKLSKDTFPGGDFHAINPKGAVPTLELDNGQILTEGSAILQYIADQKPEAQLVPKWGTFERYRCQEWLNYIATELHKSFSPLFRSTTPAETREQCQAYIAKQFDYITKQLSGKTYLMGDQFTVADAYLFTVVGWTKPLKIDVSKWPTLMGYCERVQNRPATHAAMSDEGLLK